MQDGDLGQYWGAESSGLSVTIASSREETDEAKKSKIPGKKGGGTYTVYAIKCVSEREREAWQVNHAK